MVWSVHLGVLLPLLLGCAAEASFGRARWAAESFAYLITAVLFAVCASGMAERFWGISSSPWLGLAPVLTGPISVIVGTYGMRNWLGTKKREWFADASLMTGMSACAISVVLVLAFGKPLVGPVPLDAMVLGSPATWVDAFALLASTSCLIIVILACVRVAVHGDSRAWQMLAVSVLTAPVNVMLMLIVAFRWSAPLWVLVACELMFAVGLMILIRAAWKRGRIHVHAVRALDQESGLDPITRLPSGSAMVSAMDKAYNRSLKLEHRPVLIMVRLFNADDIVKDCGDAGLSQVVLATLARIRKVVSPADMVGRYYPSCFVVQINGRVTPQYLRGLGLRLASSVRRPVVPRLPPSGFEDDEPIETEIGVGICWCNALDDLTMALHEAELACEFAQTLRSRAAVKLSPETEPVAVEKALGDVRRPSFADSATTKMQRSRKRLADRLLPRKRAAKH